MSGSVYQDKSGERSESANKLTRGLIRICLYMNYYAGPWDYVENLQSP